MRRSLLTCGFPKGRLAQLEERHVHTVEVGRSRLPSPTPRRRRVVDAGVDADQLPPLRSHARRRQGADSPTPRLLRRRTRRCERPSGPRSVEQCLVEPFHPGWHPSRRRGDVSPHVVPVPIQRWPAVVRTETGQGWTCSQDVRSGVAGSDRWRPATMTSAVARACRRRWQDSRDPLGYWAERHPVTSDAPAIDCGPSAASHS